MVHARQRFLIYELLATFVGLRFFGCAFDTALDGSRLEDVASGYWTPSVKWSSGLISHYGSTPSSSARLSTKFSNGIIGMFDRWQTHWS
jgi:hypothetical protein